MTDSPLLAVVLDDRREFEHWWKTTRDPYLAVDTETTGLDVWNDRLRMVQFGDTKRGYAIPVERSDFGRELVNWALWYATGEGRELLAHRSKFDYQFLMNAGFDAHVIRGDSKASSHLIDSTCSGAKEAAAARFGSWVMDGEINLKRTMRKNKWTWATIPTDNFDYWWYGALDPVLEARLQESNMPTIDQHYRTLYDMELDVWQALSRAERRGMVVDLDYCWQELMKLETRILELEEIWAEREVNLASPAQLGMIFRAAGHDIPDTPKSGKPSVTEEVLEHLLAIEPENFLARDALEYRRLNKNATTYFGSYIDHEVGGRIHTFVETLGALTGRMSSRDPNLQNVPKRRDGDYVRRAFMASPGNTLVLADYSQIEYRIFASAAGEPDMIEAILAGEDLHAVTARLVYNDPAIDSDDPRRSVAKNANFAEIYMAGTKRFADTADISQAEANTFKKKYHKQFTRVKPFQQAVMRYAQSNGLAVDTKFGRRVPVSAHKLYAGVNYMIQGSAADVLKRAIQRIATTQWDEFFVLPIHDELIFDVPDELVPQLVRELPEIMEDRETFDVPLEVDISTAYRWGEKKEVAA